MKSGATLGGTGPILSGVATQINKLKVTASILKFKKFNN